MNMQDMIKSFPDQLLDQYNSIKDLVFSLDDFSDIDRIVISGMGGSAISGDIVKLILRNNIKKTVHIIRDYNCEELYKNDSTLFIMSSYSGNTEETLSMYKVAKACSKKNICITTGGELKRLADEDGIPVVSIPEGFQPRAALGYSLISLIVILDKLNLISNFHIESILNSAPKLHSFYDSNCRENQYAHKISKNIYGGFITIYGTASTEPIVSRFRAQIAENAKLLTSDHMLPELNHNEIEGFGTNPFPDIPRHAIWISDKDDHKQVLKRIQITSEILSDIDVKNFYINLADVDKDDFVTRSLKLVYLTDWISYYLAEFNKVDPVPVDTIMKLKNKMA